MIDGQMNPTKLATRFTIVLSVLVNGYYLVTWFYVSNLYGTQRESVNHFLKLSSFEFSISALTFFLFLLTILSIIFLLRMRNLNYGKVLIPLQLIFIALYIWGSM
jgi:hypothetical protein